MIDDDDIIVSIKENPEFGFRLLLAKYKVSLYWHIGRLVVLHSDAQDAVQETFLRIFRCFKQFRGDCSFSTWIYRIATNEALRIIHNRKDKPSPLDDILVDVAGLRADNYIDYTDLEAIKLQKAILTLPSKQQITFNLRYYDELEYEQIAAITNSTINSAKANYHTAKERIIQYMNSND